MNRRGRTLGVLVTATAAMSVTAGCTSSGGGTSDEVCAYRVRYEGRTYGDLAHVEFETGERIGIATVPPCPDTSDDGPAASGTVRAYAVRGIDPTTAIAVGNSPAHAVIAVVDPGRGLESLPPEVRALVPGR